MHQRYPMLKSCRSPFGAVLSAALLGLVPAGVSAQVVRRVVPEALQLRRVALVIGNSAYPRNPLVNPSHDSSDVKAALERLGFMVTAASDMGLLAMQDSVNRVVLSLQKRRHRVFLLIWTWSAFLYAVTPRMKYRSAQQRRPWRQMFSDFFALHGPVPVLLARAKFGTIRRSAVLIARTEESRNCLKEHYYRELLPARPDASERMLIRTRDSRPPGPEPGRRGKLISCLWA
jgi:Caspase domain